MSTKPLTQRPLDLLYFSFFLVSALTVQMLLLVLSSLTSISNDWQCHVPATVLLGIQALYTAPWLPTAISSLPKIYVEMSQDPLVGGAMGLLGSPENYVWFFPFQILEVYGHTPSSL